MHRTEQSPGVPGAGRAQYGHGHEQAGSSPAVASPQEENTRCSHYQREEQSPAILLFVRVEL